jgi:hypothetical protein
LVFLGLIMSAAEISFRDYQECFVENVAELIKCFIQIGMETLSEINNLLPDIILIGSKFELTAMLNSLMDDIKHLSSDSIKANCNIILDNLKFFLLNNRTDLKAMNQVVITLRVIISNIYTNHSQKVIEILVASFYAQHYVTDIIRIKNEIRDHKDVSMIDFDSMTLEDCRLCALLVVLGGLMSSVLMLTLIEETPKPRETLILDILKAADIIMQKHGRPRAKNGKSVIKILEMIKNENNEKQNYKRFYELLHSLFDFTIAVANSSCNKELDIICKSLINMFTIFDYIKNSYHNSSSSKAQDESHKRVHNITSKTLWSRLTSCRPSGTTSFTAHRNTLCNHICLLCKNLPGMLEWLTTRETKTTIEEFMFDFGIFNKLVEETEDDACTTRQYKI